MDREFGYDHSHHLVGFKSTDVIKEHCSLTRMSNETGNDPFDASLQKNGSAVGAAKLLGLSREIKKKNPAKGRVSRLLVGRVALFPLREKPSSHLHSATQLTLCHSLSSLR